MGISAEVALAVAKKCIDEAVIGAGGVPSGGTTGQVLKKVSGTDYDTEWADALRGRALNYYNVLDYGLVADGTETNPTDNTSALNTLISQVSAGSVIFFPQGVYLIEGQITTNKHVIFEGVTSGAHHNDTEGKTFPESAILIGTSFPTNTTAFVRSNNWARMIFRGMAFYAHALYKIQSNTAAFSSLPYDYFEVVNSANAEDSPANLTRLVNCIDFPHYVEDCYFEGFSGYAIKIDQHKYVNNSSFYSCNVGVQISDTDCVIDKCWFNSGNIAIDLYNESHNYVMLGVSDTWCDAMMSHFIYAENTDTIGLLISNAWIDMINKSAIYAPNGQIDHSIIEGRFSRCGMRYAGITSGQATDAIYKDSDVIYGKRIKNSEFNVACQKRNIGIGNNKNGICPYKLVDVTDAGQLANVRIVTDMAREDITASGTYQAEIHNYNGEDGEKYKSWDYTDMKVTVRNSTPVGSARAVSANRFAYDTTNKKLYRSTGANDVNAWELALDSGQNAISSIKTVAAASSDFADFQTRMAAL